VPVVERRIRQSTGARSKRGIRKARDPDVAKPQQPRRWQPRECNPREAAHGTSSSIASDDEAWHKAPFAVRSSRCQMHLIVSLLEVHYFTPTMDCDTELGCSLGEQTF